jgi:hypothetical protein
MADIGGPLNCEKHLLAFVMSVRIEHLRYRAYYHRV